MFILLPLKAFFFLKQNFQLNLLELFLSYMQINYTKINYAVISYSLRYFQLTLAHGSLDYAFLIANDTIQFPVHQKCRPFSTKFFYSVTKSVFLKKLN